jgi:hypothetical protein
MQHHVAPKRYLLVHHGPLHTGDPWLQAGLPITFGACRTDVRAVAGIGSTFVFIANNWREGQRPTPRYALSALFTVAERIPQDEALHRYGQRPNVEIDVLPTGRVLAEQVRAYVTAHAHELRWPDFADVEDVTRHPEDYVMHFASGTYVHAWWDAHGDWRVRMGQPYLVSDMAHSCILTPRIAYDDLRVICPELLDGEELQNRWGVHSKRWLSEQTVATLWARFPREASTPALRDAASNHVSASDGIAG